MSHIADCVEFKAAYIAHIAQPLLSPFVPFFSLSLLTKSIVHLTKATPVEAL